MLLFNALCVWVHVRPCVCVLYRSKVLQPSLKLESKIPPVTSVCLLPFTDAVWDNEFHCCGCECVCMRVREWRGVRQKREGNNLFITGISRNSSSMVLGISPIRHWLEREKEGESMCFHTHNSKEEVRGDRGSGPAHTQTHTQTKEVWSRQRTKCFADTLSGLWWTDHDHNRGRRLTHIHLHKQWMCAVPLCIFHAGGGV